ncbi:MAG TPA: hypothetical protein VEU47_19060 [Candidatus Cybelea sp.]|nr:hypothetical protein [Candidatus Cybelea sp.]
MRLVAILWLAVVLLLVFVGVLASVTRQDWCQPDSHRLGTAKWGEKFHEPSLLECLRIER